MKIYARTQAIFKEPLYPSLVKLYKMGFDGPLALDLYRYNYMDVAEGCLSHIRKLIDNSLNGVSN